MIPKETLAVVLIAAMGGGSTLHNSNVSFKDALKACPGALGSVSFSLGHSRVATSTGVETDETYSGNGTVHVVLQDSSGKKSARATIDQTRRSVSAKNTRTGLNGTVACVFPD
jgi:hypothetical protein